MKIWLRRGLMMFNDSPRPSHVLTIVGPDTVVGEYCTLSVLYDGLPVTGSPAWSVTSGSEYGYIDNTGTFHIRSAVFEGDITVQCSYNGSTATKNVLVTYADGADSETSTAVDTIVNPDTGETSQIITVTTETTDENGDVTVNTTETITNYDSSGNVTGTTEVESVQNPDGSSQSTTTNYDTNGDPTSATNNTVDTSGNSSTQDIVFDDEGNEVVTGYAIDTTDNPDGTKQFNGDGVNTEYYAFDLTHGFVLDFNFTINFAQQPAGQNENHHNILTMKRSTPEPWYGFQLRQTGTTKSIIIGTQFSTGSNTNTTIIPQTTTGDVEYSLKITYDPTVNTNTFVCRNMLTNTVVFSSDKKFPDLPELRYLKVTIGYAMDENGDPYRFSNINVKNFSIRRLTNVESPVISCDGTTVTMTCATAGATIYYRLNQLGSYVAYNSPLSISADTVVQAYAELNGDTSNTVTQTCVYDNGIERPVIDCDGEWVTITCGTPSVDLYYRLNETGSYTLYTEAITLSANTIVEAYAELNGNTSPVVSENCVYSPVVLVEPVISCNGSMVTITCSTSGATIYYRLNQTGSYTEYSTPISIVADTEVEAYSTYRGRTSSVVTETCVYNPVHDYSQDYLTFRVLTGGTIVWKAFGSGYTKTIEYSLNNGAWTSIAASTSPTPITVAANDVVRFRGSNNTYAGSKTNYDGFDGGTATFDIEGNIMSLVYGDNFANNSTLSGTYNFCSMFKQTNVVSAENLVLPSTTLTNYCYRAMFSKATSLTTPPELPATALSQGCYWYMFEECPMTTAPDLLATTLVRECYGYMFTGCNNLNYIKCMANDGFSTYQCLQGWVNNVAATGTFVKDVNTTWASGNNGIPSGWTTVDDGTIIVSRPSITCDGEEVTITCSTSGASIYYRTGTTGSYSLYTTPFSIYANTVVQAYGELNGETGLTANQYCEFISNDPIEACNRTLNIWTHNGQSVQTPYSVNAIDGHSSSYAKGTFNFETSFVLRSVQPTYLWFQHADQSASVYIDNTLVEKHWGGYNAFFVDISNNVHTGSNNLKVALKNNEGNNLAPASGDFNFNATLGNVKLFTSPVLPSMDYGYDGFHVSSTVTSSSATVYVKTAIPSGATVECSITDGTYTFSDEMPSTGAEMTFTAVIQNPHLWNGTADPHLYTITLDIYYNGELYHRYERPYGLRYYEYVINDTSVLQSGDPYTGFLLNGSPYLLRGVCMHDDVDGKANALTDADYTQEFNIIQELGCNFLRLAHYPHPKEVYDWCDRLGIIVQTEGPCVNKMQSTMPTAYYTNLENQYRDMVNQHYNHPCIVFWGLSNETTTDDKDFAKAKIEAYTTIIKTLDPSRLVGYVMSHSYSNPSSYYNNPNVDWFGCNIYVGWYIDKASNNPTSQLNTRVTNIITNTHKALAFSEYGCGGTQHCHSEDPQTTTTKGNYERHDIEYQMWLHEGHIAAIRNFPQLLFTSQWQLFDIAVSNRNEGYTICLDGETTTTDDNLRRLNNKGLVERDHVTKKDTFYLYKAEWNPTPFVHICGKDYTKKTSRVIKCYTNDPGPFSLYVDSAEKEDTIYPVNNILTFDPRNFYDGETVEVSNARVSDSFTFGS